LFVIDGEARLNDRPAGPGDAAKISAEPALHLSAASATEVLLLDLP